MRHVRLLTRTFEAIHAPAYFAHEVRDAWQSVGLEGYWMGYFASRAAPMGRVEAATVEATFPSFTPRRIRRAIPAAWDRAAPAEILAARDAAVVEVLDGAWSDVDPATRSGLAARCRELAAALDAPAARSSRPLFAANAARPWPDGDTAAIFRASTVVREYRGDTHMALLVASGLDGIEANVLAAATPAYDRDWVRQSRGWGDEQWDAAVARLVDRGWINEDWTFTTGGRAWRSELETRTDELVAPAVARFGDREAVETLTADLAPLARAVVATLPASAPHRLDG